MLVARQSEKLGRLWARVLLICLAHLRRRAARFDVTVWGEEHLTAMTDRSFVLVSNHNSPNKSDFWPLAHVRYFKRYHYSTDSFIYHWVLQERIGRTINTVSLCGATRWLKHPLRLWIQRHIGLPFARGEMAMMPGYIGVEKAPGSNHRRFLDAIAAAVQRNEPILIFPGDIKLASAGESPCLSGGAAHIAGKHDIMILVACIVGSESWNPGNPVTIAFGEAFSPHGLSKKQINKEIADRIQTLLAIHVPGHANRGRKPGEITSQST